MTFRTSTFFLKRPGRNEFVDGQDGIDTAAQVGSDYVRNIEILLDGGGEKNIVTFLQVRTTILTPELVWELLIDASNAFRPCNFEFVATATSFTSSASTGSFTNDQFVYDVNNDGVVSPLDALLVINELSSGNGGAVSAFNHAAMYPDVNADGFVSPIDALIVINELNSSPANSMAAASYFATIDQTEDAEKSSGELRTIDLVFADFDAV